MSQNSITKEQITNSIKKMIIPDAREFSLKFLCDQKDQIPELGSTLWYSFGISAVLLHEITSFYPYLSCNTISPRIAQRVCCSIALLQIMAKDKDARSGIIEGDIYYFIFPLFHGKSDSAAIRYVQLMSLEFLGELVKHTDTDTLKMFLNTEIVDICINILEKTHKMSKIIALFILQQFVNNPECLNVISQKQENVTSLVNALANITNSLDPNSAICTRTLKHIFKCYLGLLTKDTIKIEIQQKFPESLETVLFAKISNDNVMRKDYTTFCTLVHK